MNIETSVDLKKGRSGEKVFAVALFLTLVVAATIAWFIIGQKDTDETSAFIQAHQHYVQAADAATEQMIEKFSALVAACAEEPNEAVWSELLAAYELKNDVSMIGIFKSTGQGKKLDGTSVFAISNPALHSAVNSPYLQDVLYARSPYSGEKAVLFTAAFQNASGESCVLMMEADEVALGKLLLQKDPERKDILFIVSQDGSVIASTEEAKTIGNLIKWAESASINEDLPHPSYPLYVLLRDRIAGFGTFTMDAGGFTLGVTNIKGTDWMLAQIEMK